MVHVKVLVVVVLCSSCFVQDALSVTGKREGSVNVITNWSKVAVALADVAAAPTKVAAAPSKVAAAPAKVAVAPSNALMTWAKSAATPAKVVVGPRQQAEAGRNKMRVIEVLARPPKYLALYELMNGYFDTWERVILVNESGKVVMRDVRNILSDGLTNPGFWTAVSAALEHVAKRTNDAKKAQLHVDRCKAVTDWFTRPGVADKYERFGGQVYEAAISLDLAPYVLLASDVTDMIERDQLSLFLVEGRRMLNEIDLDPSLMTDMFNNIKMFMDLSGLASNKNFFTGTIANAVTQFGAFLNRKENKVLSPSSVPDV